MNASSALLIHPRAWRCLAGATELNTTELKALTVFYMQN